MKTRKIKKEKKQEILMVFLIELFFSILFKDYLISNYLNLFFYIIGIILGNVICFFISKFIFSIQKRIEKINITNTK